MGVSMMLVFMKVVYTWGNIAMVFRRPGQYKPGQLSLYTPVCIERKGNDAGGSF